MNQRDKARAMMRSAGHGDQLKHLSVKVVPKGSAMNAGPNQVAEVAATDPGTGMGAGPDMSAPTPAPPPGTPPSGLPGLMRGGRVC